MNSADILTAALRQTAAAKAGTKGGGQASDGKDKADHFREQLRVISKERKAIVPQAANVGVDTKSAEETQIVRAAGIIAEPPVDTGQMPDINDDRDETRDDDQDTPKPARGDEQAAKPPVHWRGPDVALSAMLSKLDRAQTSPSGDREAAPSKPVAAVDIKAEDVSFDPAEMIDVTAADVPDPSAPSSQRFAKVVEAMDTKPLPAVKAVVREIETHFEPTQQVPVLQKIADRVASDLPAVASPDGAKPADAPVFDANKTADSRPVRMMTLELDPPNLGSVTVKMRLAGDSVVIHVTADRYETTQMLRQERGALTDAMQSAGYTFDIAAIDHARTPDGNLNNSQQQQAPADQRSLPQSPGGSQSNGDASGRSFGDSQGGARHNRHNHEQLPQQPERQQNQTGGLTRSSTVYL